jgi:hypothetical protein
VHCSLCGKRVSSRASLSGHYRRKHSDRAPARSGVAHAAQAGQRAATGPELQQRASNEQHGPRGVLGTPGQWDTAASAGPEPEPGSGDEIADGGGYTWGNWGWFLPGLLILAAVIFGRGGLRFGPSSASEDSALVSGYAPSQGGPEGAGK